MIKFLALGDSYTIGEGVAANGRWPVQLTAALRRHGQLLADPRIVARTGWTVAELRAGLKSAGIGSVYDLVSLQIGVNDQYRGYSIEQYRREFGELLHQAISLAGGQAGKVMMLSIPDWSVTPYAQGRDRRKIADEIIRFNQVNREKTLGAGANYIDITPASRQAAGDRSLLAPDGLHPSARMYAIWLDLILPVALKILNAEAINGEKSDEI